MCECGVRVQWVHDALDGAAVDLFEDLRIHAKYFQPPEGEEALSSTLRWFVWTMIVPSDVDTKELKALNLLHQSPVDVNGVCSALFL
jgi:hypothetical protein